MYIEMLECQIGSLHPALVQLVRQCLHNVPHHRPSTEELLATLQRLREEVEGEYGGSPIRLDMVRVRLAKEVKTKDRRIQELAQQQVIHSYYCLGSYTVRGEREHSLFMQIHSP